MDETSDVAEREVSSTAQQFDDRALMAGLLAECDDQSLTVMDDLPDDPSISLSELDAIERYMGDILDQVLGHHCGEGSGTTRRSAQE